MRISLTLLLLRIGCLPFGRVVDAAAAASTSMASGEVVVRSDVARGGDGEGDGRHDDVRADADERLALELGPAVETPECQFSSQADPLL